MRTRHIVLPVAAAISHEISRKRKGCSAEESVWGRERTDAYGGISVDAGELPKLNIKNFEKLLNDSVVEWKEHRKIRGVWLHIPKNRAEFVGAAVTSGFAPHHANPNEIVLTRWLPDDEPNPLPPGASHHVGVGCVVLDPTNRVLLVKEKWGKFKSWKIITGIVEARENIADAALREVKEETGIHVTFDRVIALRHSHIAPFEKSDVFFLCLLRADRYTAAQPLIVEQAEITQAQWTDFNQFRNMSPYPRDTPVWDRLYSLVSNIIQEEDQQSSQIGLTRATFPTPPSRRSTQNTYPPTTIYFTADRKKSIDNHFYYKFISNMRHSPL